MHHIIILVLCLAILTASFLFVLEGDTVRLFGFNCPFRCFLYHVLKVKCALCGLTRSFSALAHGDFNAAFSYHLIGPSIFAFICLQIPYRIAALIIYPRKMNNKLIKTNIVLTAVIVSAIFLNWFLYLGGLLL